MPLRHALILAACIVPACAQSMEWPTIAPAQAGLDPAKLESWRANLAAHGTTGLIVIRRGRIALEWYAPEWNDSRPHGTASMAKALVGGMSLAVAMSDGRISPDDLASRYIPAWAADPLKSKITIRQLATHTSGIADAEQDGLPHDQLPGWKGDFWKRTPDPFSIAINLAPVLFEPGTKNAYSNPGMAALSCAITASLHGGDVRSLLKERIFDPLGIPERHWSIGYGRAYEVDGLKLYANWGGATFTARAAARIGQLMMLQGQWNGRELIRREIVKKVLTDQGMPRPSRSPTDPAPASGLAWYVNRDSIWPAAPRDAFAGAGASHQVIVVVPSLDLIVVRNGDSLADAKAGFWGPVYDLVVKPLMEAVTVRAPYPPSPVILGASFGSDLRRAAIDSDNWPLTWGDDDALYTSYGDGYGFEPFVEKKLGMGFARITGGPGEYHGVNLRSDGERTGNGAASPKASGILMVDGILYLWVRNVANAQLLWSNDRGKTWQWGFKMETAFGSPTFLNFGRNYAGARDGYVYTFSQDGPSAYESDNALLLARVPKDRIRDRAAWEFLERLDPQPVWTPDITRRGAVFSYPANCRRVDAVYDAPLKRYLMALAYDHDGGWGLFDAPAPWGPWTTVLHREWDIAGTHGYRLPSKWISADGLTLTLVFSGVKPNDAFCTRTLTLSPQEHPTFRAGAALVHVDAEVGQDRRIIDNLGVESFRVFDNGAPQKLIHFAHQQEPLDVVLLFDTRYEMRPALQRIAEMARKALGELRPEDQVAVMAFGGPAGKCKTDLIMDFTSDFESAARSITHRVLQREFRPLTNGCQSIGGIDDAAQELIRQPAANRRRAIVVISDDHGTATAPRAVQRTRQDLWQADAVVLGVIVPTAARAIWIGPPYRGSRYAADQTGGDIVNSADVAEGLQEALRRLRSRYSLYYELPQGTAGEQRKIRVELGSDARKRYPRAAVRARTGYIMPTDAQ